MIEAAKHVANTQPLPPRYDARLEAGLTEIMAILPDDPQQQKRWFAIKLFEKDEAIQTM